MALDLKNINVQSHKSINTQVNQIAFLCWVDIWFMRFGFGVGFKPIFENRAFRDVLEPFYPLKRPQTSKNPLRHNFDGKIPNPFAMA